MVPDETLGSISVSQKEFWDLASLKTVSYENCYLKIFLLLLFIPTAVEVSVYLGYYYFSSLFYFFHALLYASHLLDCSFQGKTNISTLKY